MTKYLTKKILAKAYLIFLALGICIFLFVVLPGKVIEGLILIFGVLGFIMFIVWSVHWALTKGFPTDD